MTVLGSSAGTQGSVCERVRAQSLAQKLPLPVIVMTVLGSDAETHERLRVQSLAQKLPLPVMTVLDSNAETNSSVCERVRVQYLCHAGMRQSCHSTCKA